MLPYGCGVPLAGTPPAQVKSIGVPGQSAGLTGGIPKGASPLCVVAEEGVTGEKPHRKGFSLRACFCLLFPRGKSRSGCGAEGPMVLRAQPRQQKNLSSPLGTKGSPSAVPPAFAPEARAHAPVTEGLRPALTGRSRANQGTPSKAAFSRWPPLSGDGKLPIFPFLACSQLLLIP